MRVTTAKMPDGEEIVGIVHGEVLIRTRYRDMLTLIRDGEAGIAAIADDLRRGVPINGGERTAPLPRPGKLLFCGVNYASHQQENPNAVMPSVPFFFSKLPTSVIGPGASIVMPEPTTLLDYEVELAVIIGRQAKRISRTDAYSHVFGYTLANDISARDVQFVDAQITLGKGYDSFCPMGPEIVLRDELHDPTRISLTTLVNGERRQFESAEHQLFPIPVLLEYLSRHITLEPGDVVSTGTPAGIGHFMNPPGYLRVGDEVTIEANEIGSLTNRVVAGWLQAEIG